MDKSPITFHSIVLAMVFSFAMLSLIGFRDIFYHKTKIVFCNVGQGDAAYIRTREKQDILIDAGPDRKVLSCLGKYMPFYDRKIELALLSHPQKDHYGGYLEVVDRYKIDNFIFPQQQNNSQLFKQLNQKIKQKKIKIRNMLAGEKVVLKALISTRINILWPSKEFVTDSATKPNEISQIFLYSYGDFNILFTGDASAKVLNSLVGTIHELSLENIDILKIPHHGSKNGLTKELLKLANPKLSVISVGRNNSYGHPAPGILEMLKALKKKYLRTDEKGDVVVEVGERGWTVE
jgi:competence protein ComEC